MIHINPQTLTVTRTAPQGVDQVTFLPTGGAETTFEITATVQPLKGREREDLPEGYRASNMRKMYTESDLRVISVETGEYSDIIALEDGDYEVFSKDDRRSRFAHVSHYRYVLVRVGADEG